MRFGLTVIAVFVMLAVQSATDSADQLLSYIGYGTLLFAALLEIASIHKGIPSD